MCHSYTYDHVAYDTLPDLQDAANNLAARDGSVHLKSLVRDVYMRHGMNHDFSVQLLHKHFSMDPSEKLVEYGPTQSPWPAATVDRVVGGHIVPKSWRIWNGELHPYEFQFVSMHDDSCPKPVQFPEAFVKDLGAVLDELHLTNLLGVTAIDHRRLESDVELMEVTYGRNSCMIPVIKSEVPKQSYNAGWSFVEMSGEAKSDYQKSALREESLPGDEVTTTDHPSRRDSHLATEGTKTLHGICSSAAGVDTVHGVCSAAAGTKVEHGICSAAEGVNILHGICSAVEGTKTLHGVCSAAAGTKVEHGICSSASGVGVKHGICSAIDGTQTTHGICSAAEGTRTLHGICSAANGVKTLHGICSAANGIRPPCSESFHSASSAVDGLETLHGICSAMDGVRTMHGIRSAAPTLSNIKDTPAFFYDHSHCHVVYATEHAIPRQQAIVV